MQHAGYQHSELNAPCMHACHATFRDQCSMHACMPCTGAPMQPAPCAWSERSGLCVAQKGGWHGLRTGPTFIKKPFVVQNGHGVCHEQTRLQAGRQVTPDLLRGHGRWQAYIYVTCTIDHNVISGTFCFALPSVPHQSQFVFSAILLSTPRGA